MDIETIISEGPCAKLLEEIQQHFKVQFSPWEEKYCAFQVAERENGAEGKPTLGIVYYYEACSKGAIVHELLHAKYEYLFDNEKFLLVDEQEVSEATFKLLNYKYWEDFGNQIQHYIMFSEYKLMGYDPNEFFEGVNFSGNKMKRFVQKGLRIGSVYDAIQVKNYLNTILHLRFFPIDDRFNKYLPQLEKLDKPLFKIHQNLYKVVKDLDLDAQYYDVLHEAERIFRQDLCKWIDNRSKKISVPDSISEIE